MARLKLQQGSNRLDDPNLFQQSIVNHFSEDMFALSMTWDESTTHPKVDMAGVRTHDLLIMTVHLSLRSPF